MVPLPPTPPDPLLNVKGINEVYMHVNSVFLVT